MNKENTNFGESSYQPDSEYPLSDTAHKVIIGLRNIINNINNISPLYENEELSNATNKLEKLIEDAMTEEVLPIRTNIRYRNPISGVFNPLAAPLVSPSTSENIFYINFPKVYQSVPNVVHGGIVSSVMDDVIQKTAQKAGYYCFTSEIKVVFRKKTPIETDLIVKGEVVDIKEGQIVISANIFDGDVITASALATMIPIKFNLLKNT